MPQPNIVICSDREALNRKTAQLLVQLTGQAIAGNRRATLALSGGSTPKSLYELLATAEWRERIVSLPLYAEMTPAQRTAVIEGVRSFYRP